jgi:hypothetical protein
MIIQVVAEDRVVSIDGEGVNFDFVIDRDIWAIQWDGTVGHIEYNDGKPNSTITSFIEYQYLIDGHATEKASIEALAIQAETDRVANLTYQEKREAAYPPMSEYLDGIVKGDTAQVDQYIADCLAVKALYPAV